MKLKSLTLLATRLESGKKETILPSGIILLGAVKEYANTPLRGEVKQVGPGLPGVPIEVKIGDVVIYKKDSVITDVDGMDLLDQPSLILIEESDEK